MLCRFYLSGPYGGRGKGWVVGRVGIVNTKLTKYRTTFIVTGGKVGMGLCRVGPGGGAPTRGGSGFTRLIYSGSLGTGHVSSTTKLLGRRVEGLSSLYLVTTSRGSITTNNTLTISHRLFTRFVARGVGSRPGVRIVGRIMARVPYSTVAIVTANPLASNRLTSGVSGLYGNKGLDFCSTTTPVIAGSDVSFSGIFCTTHCSGNATSCVGYPVGGRRCAIFCGRLVGTRNTPLRSVSGGPGICRKYVPIRVLTGQNRSSVHFNPLGPIKLHSPEASGHP